MINNFVGWFEDGRRSVKPNGSASATRVRGIGAVAGVALTMSLFAASGAQAQNCVLGPTNNVFNLASIGSSPASISSMLSATITTANTAFLLQSTAFIGSPANPAPDQQGGGIWVRGVGGQVDIKSNTNTTVSQAPVPAGATSTVTCSQQVNESFAGVQLGSDLARLNINGWNFHVGTTVGYLGTKDNLVGGAFAFTDPATGLPAGGGSFTGTTQVPFIGAYAAATYGGFSVDALLRAEYYQTSLNAPGANLVGQNIDAHGYSFSSSMAYQWNVPNSKWFIEPSAGIIISRVTVDPFNFTTAGTAGANLAPPPVTIDDRLSGTLALNQIDSDIGRIGLRFGTTIDGGQVIWQPFGAVSVWHEFGPNVTSNYATAPGSVFFRGGTLVTISAASSTSTFGTYGQYSIGVSGLLAGTGWLGFARVDYRDGPNLQGLSGTGGIRYQFTPDMAVASRAMPVKAPVYKAPVMTAVNWTGFYIGGFGGATQGTADWGYVGGEVSPHIGGYLFGGDIGYNYQTGSYVFGVEGDLSTTNTKGGTACGPLSVIPVTLAAGSMFQMTCNANANWIATATARAGYTWDRALLYVKGGGAWTDEQFSATCNFGPLNAVFLASGFRSCSNPAGAFSNGLTASSGRDGWTIGTGTEFALTPNWSAKAEADYVSFGDTTVAASDGSALKVGMHLWEEKVGLNYRFNTGPAGASH
jgi:outer membrane autotransporter protein